MDRSCHSRWRLARVPLVVEALAITLLLTLAGCGSGPDLGTRKIDVVIVLVDTLRADFTELGGRAGTSPRLAELARESVVFEQAYSAGPWTLPSVASLFTGGHLVEHGVVHDRLQLAEEATTLAELLSEAGYFTGSFHSNPYAGERFGMHQGFDMLEQREAPTGARHLEGFWTEAGSRPYLLYVHNAEPHDPLRARARFRRGLDQEFLDEYGRLVTEYRALTRVDWAARRPVGTTDNTDEQLRRAARLDELAPEVHALYEASVRDADERIGSIVDALRRDGRWDHTLFVVLSDHGEEMGEHGGWQHDQSVYEELVHVPLLVHLPGSRHAGERVRTPVSIIDLLPTVLHVAGVSPGALELSGRSLLELLEGEPPARPEPRLVSMRDNHKKYFRPFKEGRGDLNLVVREGDWKAILNVETAGVELYDLASDPVEQQDLAAEHPQLAARLGEFAAASHARLQQRARQATSGGVLHGDEDVLQSLRDLGYVGDEEPPAGDR